MVANAIRRLDGDGDGVNMIIVAFGMWFMKMVLIEKVLVRASVSSMPDNQSHQHQYEDGDGDDVDV